MTKPGHDATNTSLRPFRAPPLPAAAQEEFEKAKQWLSRTDAPLFIEVGCGVGFHPILWSKQNTSSRLLAFERTHEKYEKAARRFLNNGSPSNVHIAHADAAVMLPHLLSEGAAIVQGFYFLYPNPYPKASQANLRLAHSPFLHFVKSVLLPNGTLTLATNSANYAREVEEILPQLGFTLVSKSSPQGQPRSHFEKKYLSRGETCWDLRFSAP